MKKVVRLLKRCFSRCFSARRLVVDEPVAKNDAERFDTSTEVDKKKIKTSVTTSNMNHDLKLTPEGVVDCEYYREKNYNSYLNYLHENGVTATPLSKEEYLRKFIMR